jgi:hypothetical protein
VCAVHSGIDCIARSRICSSCSSATSCLASPLFVLKSVVPEGFERRKRRSHWRANRTLLRLVPLKRAPEETLAANLRDGRSPQGLTSSTISTPPRCDGLNPRSSALGWPGGRAFHRSMTNTVRRPGHKFGAGSRQCDGRERRIEATAQRFGDWCAIIPRPHQLAASLLGGARQHPFSGHTHQGMRLATFYTATTHTFTQGLQHTRDTQASICMSTPPQGSWISNTSC